MITLIICVNQFIEELNDPKYQGPTIKIPWIFPKIFTMPSKTLVHIWQPLIIFGNLPGSLWVIFQFSDSVWVITVYQKSSVTF